MDTRIEVEGRDDVIIVFDGQVLETFGAQAARIHLRHIKGLQLTEDRRGQLVLDVSAKTESLLIWFDPVRRGEVESLVAAVNAAVG